MKKEYVYDPLTKEEFKKRIISSFPAVYLTIISIIQGVALGILAYNTFGYIKNPEFAGRWLMFIPYSIISFIIILIVSYEYAWFVGIFRWSPRIWDSVVPFTLGFSELIPMFFLTRARNWFLSTGIFCFIGALAFLNSVKNCKKDMFENDKINYRSYRRTKNELLTNILISMIAGLFCIFISIFAPIKSFYSYKGNMFLIFLLICGIVILWKGEKFMDGIHSDFGLTRK